MIGEIYLSVLTVLAAYAVIKGVYILLIRERKTEGVEGCLHLDDLVTREPVSGKQGTYRYTCKCGYSWEWEALNNKKKKNKPKKGNN